jgi:hypothetical protein
MKMIPTLWESLDERRLHCNEQTDARLGADIDDQTASYSGTLTLVTINEGPTT